MKQTLQIRTFKYLKRPQYSWSLVNDQGGSFSNSGMHKSLKACQAHAAHMARNSGSIERTEFIDVNADGTETVTMIESTGATALNRIFG